MSMHRLSGPRFHNWIFTLPLSVNLVVHSFNSPVAVRPLWFACPFLLTICVGWCLARALNYDRCHECGSRLQDFRATRPSETKMHARHHFNTFRRFVAIGLLAAFSSGFFLAEKIRASTSTDLQTGAAAQFGNPAAITINDGPSSPYGSSIQVSGLSGLISKVTVMLSGFQHSFPDDVDVLLVSPNGQKVELMSDCGGNRPVNNLDLTFDDAAPVYLPDFGELVSGSYKPSNFFEQSDSFPAPAANSSIAAPYGATLSSFNGADPNGTWTLYVVDDSPGDVGVIAAGWSMSIDTTAGGGSKPTLIAGAIDKPSSIQVGRLARSGINSLSPTLKSFPGVSDSKPRHFRTYAFTNSSSEIEIATATLTSTCGVDLFMSAYLSDFVPHDLSTNYVADNGSSYANTSLPMSFDVPPGTTFVIVVNEVNANTSCATYSLLVEGDFSYRAAAAKPGGKPKPQAKSSNTSSQQRIEGDTHNAIPNQTQVVYAIRSNPVNSGPVLGSSGNSSRKRAIKRRRRRR